MKFIKSYVSLNVELVLFKSIECPSENVEFIHMTLVWIVPSFAAWCQAAASLTSPTNYYTITVQHSRFTPQSSPFLCNKLVILSSTLIVFGPFTIDSKIYKTLHSR